jgi:hypothetical protein
VTEVQDLGVVDTQPEPPPPAQDIVVPPPPPPPPPPPEYDFYGLLRDVTATVSDANGCDWAEAKAGTKLDFLKVEADFGKELEALTLTFYSKLPAATAPQQRRIAHKAAWRFARAAAAPAKKCGPANAEATTSVVRSSRTGALQLKTVAQFKAFTVKRGHVVLKLLVPDQFKPDHVGMIAQEAKQVAARGKAADGTPLPNFVAFGAKAGGIYPIKDASRLHARKSAARGKAK